MRVEGWAPTKIGDFAWEPTERATPDAEVLSVTKHRGFVPSLEYFGKQVFSKDTDNYKLVRKGQFAYATIHLDEGSIDCLNVREQGIISPMYTVFDVDERRVDRAFLLELLRTPAMLARYAAIGQGSINRRKSIGFETLASEFVLLPPLPEQQKIAAILSSVDEAIQATQAVIDQTRRVKEGLLQELLTRGLPGHTRFKQTEIGEIPEGWEVVPARELARKGDLVGGPFGSDLGVADYAEAGVPVIRGGNVGLGKFIESDFVYVSPDKALLLRRNSAQRGDVIMTQRGASLGEATLIPDGAMFESYVISQTMMRLRPNIQVVEPLFLIQSMCSDRAQAWLKSRAIGNAQPHLNLSIWQQMPVAIPPKNEQMQIASIIGSLDDAMMVSGVEAAALTSLKSGLLADLLTGKVRVTP